MRTRARRWLVPSAVFVALVGSWYAANLLAYAATVRTMHAADARIVAAGHAPMFPNTSLPSVWAWQSSLRPALLGILGAALIAVVVRRMSPRPWFVLAGLLPVVVGHGGRLHPWWAAGTGIDYWTFGAGVGIPGLDLTRFGAGPSWTLAGGTLLTVAAVVVPAMFVRRTPERMSVRHLSSALPYIGLLTVAAALAVARLHVDTGDGGSRAMVVAAVATAMTATFAALVASERRFWSGASVTALAVGLVTVSGLNPGARAGTKAAAFAAGAAVSLLSAWTACRPHGGWRPSRPVRSVPQPLPHP